MIQIMAIIIVLFILIVAIDIIPIFSTWLSRIHIGRYSNKSKWSKDVVLKGKKWLNHTPKIKVTDNTRFVVLDVLRGNYTKATIQHWQEAALLLGLCQHLEIKNDEAIKKEVDLFLKRKFNNEGQWITPPQHVDGAILAYALMKIDYVNIDKYKQALDFMWQLIKEHIGEDGTVQYRKGMKEYRYVDTIGFICPFLISYGLKYEKEECIALAVKQLREYNAYGIHEKYGIPCHAYHIQTKEPLGLYGWGRGLGWYAIGLIDSWNELPNGHEYKQEVEAMVITYARNIIKYQQKDGSWRWTVTRSETQPDSSTTAMLGWFISNTIKIDKISEEYVKSYEKLIKYLMTVTRRDGAIDFSQGDTKDIGVYSTSFDTLPFTQGYSMMVINKYTNF